MSAPFHHSLSQLALVLVTMAVVAVEPVDQIEITDPGLSEISGIVAARSHDGYWVHNDSGDLPRLYAIDRSGQRVATVLISGALAVDWEDLTAFEHAGQRYLMVGDIGDNFGLMPTRSLYVIVEPELDPSLDPQTQHVVPLAWRIHFRYEDGPRDAEGLAVDPIDGSVLLLSKRSDPAMLYRLPLLPQAGDAIQVARRLCPLPAPDIPAALRAQMGRLAARAHRPTALDCSVDGRRLLVTNLVQALVYTRDPDEAWEQVVQRPPLDLGIPVLRQTEAACFDHDQGFAVITGEQLPAPLLRVPLPPVAAPSGRDEDR